MTEVNNTNMAETSSAGSELSAAEISPALEQVQTTKNEETHKPSNLRRRWKRKVGTATIKEEEITGPRELKAIKIKPEENLKTSATDFKKTCDGGLKCNAKDRRCYSKEIKATSCGCGQQTCYCRCFLGKIKHFLLKLFGFEPKQLKQKSWRYAHSGKRNDYLRRRPSRPTYRS